MLGMRPPGPNHGYYHPLKSLFRCIILHSSAHDFSSIRLGGPGGCIDPIGPLAERQRRSPHDQAEPGYDLEIEASTGVICKITLSKSKDVGYDISNSVTANF